MKTDDISIVTREPLSIEIKILSSTDPDMVDKI